MKTDNNEPLGFPKGSVRAIIAIFVTVAIIGAYIASFFTGHKADFPAEILALPAAVIFYYFGKREKE